MSSTICGLDRVGLRWALRAIVAFETRGEDIDVPFQTSEHLRQYNAGVRAIHDPAKLAELIQARCLQLAYPVVCMVEGKTITAHDLSEPRIDTWELSLARGLLLQLLQLSDVDPIAPRDTVKAALRGKP